MKAQVNEKLVGKEVSTIHKFESRGLGKAPFQFTGLVTEKVYCACPGAPAQPGSTCDYCGTCIKYEFWVRSSDGNEFKVGCDCIHKTGDSGLIKQISAAERKLRDAKNTTARERRKQRDAEALDFAKRKLLRIQGVLALRPHPNQWRAQQGDTMLDYVRWLLENTSGKTAVAIINGVND